MAAKDIFALIQAQPNRMFLVRVSFFEIYNEEVRDLLSDDLYTKLKIREDGNGGVFVQSVEKMVTDFESLLRILFDGEKSRAIASTGMNQRSSRSHTIFRITIESREKMEYDEEEADSTETNDENRVPSGDGAVRVSTLNLVDLAGSESVRRTGAIGERQKEGRMINQRCVCFFFHHFFVSDVSQLTDSHLFYYRNQSVFWPCRELLSLLGAPTKPILIFVTRNSRAFFSRLCRGTP
jgi:centromeric protein E